MRIFLLIILVFTAFTINAQIREAQLRFPLEGEVQQQKRLDFSNENLLIKKQNHITAAKTNDGYIDTTYVIRYADVFFDVNDWDSAYFVSGYVRDSTHYRYDPDHPTLLGLIKIDYSGNVLWTRTDSVMRGDHFTPNYNTNMVQLSDKKFLQIGYVDNDYNDWKNYDWRASVFTKFDTDGNTIWQRVYKDTAYLKGGDWPRSVIAEDDGGFTITALISSDSKHLNPYDTSDNYIYTDTTYIGIIRYDSLGVEIMRQKHFIGGHPVIPGLCLLMKQKDGGYIIGGTNYYSGDLRSYFLLKTDSLFNWQWRKIFGQEISAEPLMQIFEDNNNQYGFALLRSDTPIVYDAYGDKYFHNYYQIGKMDSAFNIIEDTIFNIYLTDPNNTYFYEDIGFLVGACNNNKNGITVCSRIGDYGANIVSLDSNLSFEWSNWIAQYPYFNEKAFKMRPAHDGGYLIVGYSNRWGVGGWFVKTDTNGYALPNGADTLYHIGIQASAEDLINIKIYPNPSSDYVNLQFDKLIQENIDISLYDISGSLLFKNKYSNRKSIKLYIGDYSKGVYLLQIRLKNGTVLNSKIIKH